LICAVAELRNVAFDFNVERPAVVAISFPIHVNKNRLRVRRACQVLDGMGDVIATKATISNDAAER
jgi:hypothetical protein